MVVICGPTRYQLDHGDAILGKMLGTRSRHRNLKRETSDDHEIDMAKLKQDEMSESVVSFKVDIIIVIIKSEIEACTHPVMENTLTEICLIWIILV